MKWLLGTYTSRFNRRHKLFGHLFSGRYKSLFVDGSGTGYLKTVCDYVHLNPARAKLLSSKQKLCDYRWSSYSDYLQPRADRRSWLRVARLLGEHGIPKDSPAGREQFQKNMERRRLAEDDDEFKALARGWCLGSEEFRKELLAQMTEKAGPEHFGQEIHESAANKAERIVTHELKRLGWKEKTLAKELKGALAKLQIALRLRRETTMTLAWIAKRLHMGTKTHLSHLLYWHSRTKS
jgi:hypothetical protein